MEITTKTVGATSEAKYPATQGRQQMKHNEIWTTLELETFMLFPIFGTISGARIPRILCF